MSMKQLDLRKRSSFLIKSKFLIMKRFMENRNNHVSRLEKGIATNYTTLICEQVTPLRNNHLPDERVLDLGKIENLRLATQKLNGTLIPPGRIFSFWMQIGRLTRRKGYAYGRQILDGCIVPAIGGGVCQLSNSLYILAKESGCSIVERHRHSQRITSSSASDDRDATVYWNYIDLKFKSEIPICIKTSISRNYLSVRFYTDHIIENKSVVVKPQIVALSSNAVTRSCISCGEADCVIHQHLPAILKPSKAGGITFILDGWSSEFADWVSLTAKDTDHLLLAMDGLRWHSSRYAWQTIPFSTVHSASLTGIMRSVKLRRCASQGASRQLIQISYDERIAHILRKQLSIFSEKLCVAQNLLPYLWMDGCLGGRDVSVLMNRQPIHLLHSNLNAASSLHPESNTLSDFRAPRWIAEAEREALEYCSSIITPHSYLATLYPNKTHKLNWNCEPVQKMSFGNNIVFPGPTAGRKGAYEVREAIRSLNVGLMPCGNELEGEAFWKNIDIVSRTSSKSWLEEAKVVVQPSCIEDHPSTLLKAIQAGLPVITTERAGLAGMPGVTEVAFGDVSALSEAIAHSLEQMN